MDFVIIMNRLIEEGYVLKANESGKDIIYSFKITCGDHHIDNLNINNRTKNILKRNNIKTIDDAMNNLQKLKSARGCGKDSIKNLTSAILNYNFFRLTTQEKLEYIQDVFI